MYDVYVMPINDTFAGRGEVQIIVKDGVIVGHNRSWEHPEVVDDQFQPFLIGKPVVDFQSLINKSFKPLTGFALENAQGWAEDIVSVQG